MDDDGLEAIVEFNNFDRFCQWTGQETHDLLVIRGELDPVFSETRRNKPLWEMVSSRMREISYTRNAQQCKSKWKNLVTRYKGCETMEVGEMRQDAFPFYNDMQLIFNARMQRMIWLEAQGGGGAGSTVASSSRAVVQISSNDVGEGEKKKKRKETGNSSSSVNGLKEIMEEYMRQQVEIEKEWMKAYEEREERRRVREREWRARMEALERERALMIKWWRDKEEQRKVREEARAQRRDALINALLNKLTRHG